MKRWGDVFGGAGTTVLSLLSCAVCPMCLPIYAGLLSLVGIEIAELNHIFFPFMITFALVTLGFMAYQIHRHHASWTPFKLAIMASIGMGTSAFWGYEYFLYSCMALFMGSVIWNKRSLVHEGHCC